MTFSHLEESSPSASSSSSQGNEPKDGEERDLDDEFEKSLAVFGLNRKRERKSQRRDERKRAKTAKPSRKEREDDDRVFQESTEKFQAQGDRLTNALEAMEKNQTQQLQIRGQFMTTFMEAMQSKNKE